MFIRRRRGYIPTMRQLTARTRALDKARAGRHRAGARPTLARLLWLARRQVAVLRAWLAQAYASSGVPELARAVTVLRRSCRRLAPAGAPALVVVPRQTASTAVAKRESAPERDTGRRPGAHSIRALGDTAEHRTLINNIMAGMHALRDGELAPGEMTWRDARLADRFV